MRVSFLTKYSMKDAVHSSSYLGLLVSIQSNQNHFPISNWTFKSGKCKITKIARRVIARSETRKSDLTSSQKEVKNTGDMSVVSRKVSKIGPVQKYVGNDRKGI